MVELKKTTKEFVDKMLQGVKDHENKIKEDEEALKEAEKYIRGGESREVSREEAKT